MPAIKQINILKIFRNATGRRDATPQQKRKAPVALGPKAGDKQYDTI